jgi:hypothetical protein
MEVSNPIRAHRIYTQTLIAPPEKVFPLLCPVREIEWVNDWNPRQVITESGFVELDCIFVMPDKPQDSIWVVTQWDPKEFVVEFTKVTPEFTVGKIVIRLRRGNGGQTFADISYCYTALSQEGSEFVKRFTEEYYQSFMKEWESDINYYLHTGTKKETQAPQ